MFSEVLADLQQLNTDNLGPDTAQLETLVRTRIPSTTQYSEVWNAEPEQPCRFSAATARGSNLRLDQPAIAGDWVLALVAGAAVAVGQRALIRGKRKNADGTLTVVWQRLVQVTKVAGPASVEMLRKTYCVDVELVPDG